MFPALNPGLNISQKVAREGLDILEQCLRCEYLCPDPVRCLGRSRATLMAPIMQNCPFTIYHLQVGSQISFLDNLQMMPNMPDHEITYRAGCHRMSHHVTPRLTLSVGKIFE
jgi:hypothetical protein